MNLYTYHCEPTEARRELDHWGWSLIPRSYTLFLLYFITFCIDRRKTTKLFLFFIALLLPPRFIFFSIGRNKEEDNRLGEDSCCRSVSRAALRAAFDLSRQQQQQWDRKRQSTAPRELASMQKHHHCCKCPECYEVTRMAALRRMDAPAYGDWQPEPYGYPAGYGGGQTLPPQTSGGGGGMGGGGTLGRSKGKMMSAGGPGGPNPKSQPKGGPKVNGNNSGGQGGWWPECTCSNRDWYDQVNAVSVPLGALRVGSRQ